MAVLCAFQAPAQDDAPAVNLDAKVVSKLRLKNDPPEYPPVAKVNYIQGVVRLRVVVSREGRVTAVHVLDGHPFLAVSAMDAIRKWTYRPYRIGKRPCTFITLVTVHFSLHPKVLTDLPPSAAQDLEARVEPPKIVNQPADPPSDKRVRLRVLVDSQGHALDTQRVSGNDAETRQAEQEVLHWRFSPAHWGSMPVPWYLEVDVPVRRLPA